MPKSKVTKSLKEAPFVAVDAKRRRRASDQSIRIPQIGLSGGAGFGDSIVDSDREWAAQREPVANRITYTVAADVFDNWFEVDDPKTEGKDEELNAKFQAVLSELNAKTIWIDATTYERMLGYSLVVVGFDDSDDLRTERRTGAKISQLEVYKKSLIVSTEIDRDPNSERFGLPVVYKISRGNGVQTDVHYSRTIEVATRLSKFSVLDPIWDDLTCLRNIRWGMAQTMYRYGSGFPDVKIEGASKKQLQDWDLDLSDICARTKFVHNEKAELNFKGAQGVALNPTLYYDPIFENIATGSGIPLAILRGAQAGELAGSEVNEREYFKVISSLQSKFEPFVRQLLDLLVESGQVDYDGDYVINWKPGFEPSEQTRNQAQLLEAQAQQIWLQFMTIDEVRAKASMPPLPNKEGEVVPGLTKAQPQPFGGGNPFAGGASMDQAEQLHPVLVKTLISIKDRAVSGEISKEQALAEATDQIEKFGKLEDERALNWLRYRTKKQDITLTPELQVQLQNGRKRFLDDFTKILDDALKAEK